MSREEKEKKRDGDGLYIEGSNRGRIKEKVFQGRGKSHAKGDLSNKEFYYCKKKGHIQMMCKEL